MKSATLYVLLILPSNHFVRSCRSLLSLGLFQRRLCIRKLFLGSTPALFLGSDQILELLDGLSDADPQRLEDGSRLLDNGLLKDTHTHQKASAHVLFTNNRTQKKPPHQKTKEKVEGGETETYVLLEDIRRIAILVVLAALNLFLLRLDLGFLLGELLVVGGFFLEEAVYCACCDDEG